MSQDTFKKVTVETWSDRVWRSIGYLACGAAMFLGSFPVLFLNEGRAVRNARSLEEGAGSVRSISAASVDPANEGKLVHLTGIAAPGDIVEDRAFGVAVNAIRLIRTVEMFQWQENRETRTRDKLFGKGKETVTTYNYRKGWADHQVDSGLFQRSREHKNPSRLPYDSDYVAVAKNVRVGAFRLPPELVEQIGAAESFGVTDRDLRNLPPGLRDKLKAYNGGFYNSWYPTGPEIGDFRVSFKVTRPTAVSIVARQAGSSLEPYQTGAGGTIDMLVVGNQSADTMLTVAAQSNEQITWVLRLVGFAMMFIGLTFALGPLGAVADIIPFFGTLFRMVTGIAWFFTSLALSLTVIAIGWLAYRPRIAIALLAASVVTLVTILLILKKSGSAAQPLPTPATLAVEGPAIVPIPPAQPPADQTGPAQPPPPGPVA